MFCAVTHEEAGLDALGRTLSFIISITHEYRHYYMFKYRTRWLARPRVPPPPLLFDSSAIDCALSRASCIMSGKRNRRPVRNASVGKGR